MEEQTRRRFLGATGAVVAGLGLSVAAPPDPAAAVVGTPRLPSEALDGVEVACGFTVRTGGDASQLAYGHRLKTRLRQEVLEAVQGARGLGCAEQLSAAAVVLSAVALRADAGLVRELWLRVSGTIACAGRDLGAVGEFREWEYVAHTFAT